MSEEGRLNHLAGQLGERLLAKGERVTCAESCSGGWIAKVMTDIAGSSRWFDRGFVTYSNAAKQEMLGVGKLTLARHGAVSEEVVREMATGALANSDAQWSIAVSGIAGPGGGSTDKPVGTVWFAWCGPAGLLQGERQCFAGDRSTVRWHTVEHALQGLLERLDG